MRLFDCAYSGTGKCVHSTGGCERITREVPCFVKVVGLRLDHSTTINVVGASRDRLMRIDAWNICILFKLSTFGLPR